jgi:hypothetical protein
MRMALWDGYGVRVRTEGPAKHWRRRELVEPLSSLLLPDAAILDACGHSWDATDTPIVCPGGYLQLRSSLYASMKITGRRSQRVSRNCLQCLHPPVSVVGVVGSLWADRLPRTYVDDSTHYTISSMKKVVQLLWTGAMKKGNPVRCIWRVEAASTP